MLKRKENRVSKDKKIKGKFMFVTSEEIGGRFRSYCTKKGYTHTYVLENLIVELLVKEGYIDPKELE